MNSDMKCPKCDSASIKVITELNKYLCLNCSTLFDIPPGQELKSCRIFICYGHDVFSEDVVAIRNDLQARGHIAWYDVAGILAGDDFGDADVLITNAPRVNTKARAYLIDTYRSLSQTPREQPIS